MFVETLTYNEAESIYMDIFNKFNEKFDLLIDFFEEEDLPAEKVLRVIQKAIECGTYVCFEF